MKKLITALLTVCVIFTTTSTITNASPETDKNKTQLIQVSDKLKNLNEELSKTSAEINDLQSKISTNEASIAEHKRQIEIAEEKINSLKDDINENQKILSIRLREMYKNNGFTAVNYISFLFESSSLSDLIDRVTACNEIIKKDTKLINTLNKQVTEESNSKDTISIKKKELENLNSETKNKLSEVNDKKAAQLEIQQKLEAEKANLTETITKNEMALINNDINTINTSTSYNSVNIAINNIKNTIPQITMQSVIDAANSAIKKGKDKLPTLTKGPESNSVSDSGSLSLSSYKIVATYSMEATAYTSTASEPLTASGTKPVRNPSGFSTIAVDPKVIPLGSLVYVHGYGFAKATDTGSAINGMIIDVYMNSEQECRAWGRKYNVTVNVLG